MLTVNLDVNVNIFIYVNQLPIIPFTRLISIRSDWPYFSNTNTRRKRPVFHLLFYESVSTVLNEEICLIYWIHAFMNRVHLGETKIYITERLVGLDIC